jgi:glutaredoxin
MNERITVLSKPGCHLCEDACALVAKIAAELGVPWSERDIGDDPDLVAQWSEYVPVILVDDEVHGWFRVDEARLRSALSSSTARPGPATPSAS